MKITKTENRLLKYKAQKKAAFSGQPFAYLNYYRLAY